MQRRNERDQATDGMQPQTPPSKTGPSSRLSKYLQQEQVLSVETPVSSPTGLKFPCMPSPAQCSSPSEQLSKAATPPCARGLDFNEQDQETLTILHSVSNAQPAFVSRTQSIIRRTAEAIEEEWNRSIEPIQEWHKEMMLNVRELQDREQDLHAELMRAHQARTEDVQYMQRHLEQQIKEAAKHADELMKTIKYQGEKLQAFERAQQARTYQHLYMSNEKVGSAWTNMGADTECQVCMTDVMFTPFDVFQCKGGHMVCGKCVHKKVRAQGNIAEEITECPCCSGTEPLIKNFLFSRLRAELQAEQEREILAKMDAEAGAASEEAEERKNAAVCIPVNKQTVTPGPFESCLKKCGYEGCNVFAEGGFYRGPSCLFRCLEHRRSNKGLPCQRKKNGQICGLPADAASKGKTPYCTQHLHASIFTAKSSCNSL